MTHITYKDNAYICYPSESVLECLTRHGLTMPYACKSGVCQSCMMHVKDGDLPPASQFNLKPIHIKKGMFLSCQCYPTDDITVENMEDAGFSLQATLINKEWLSYNVLRVTLKPLSHFVCEPGQYITLINTDQVGRSYSVSNNPSEEGVIKIHIRLLRKGRMSTWMKKNQSLNSTVLIRGPFGNCFYAHQNTQNIPIILAGTGTGLAPLYGIINTALSQGHLGPITLFHGARTSKDLYLVNELTELTHQHQNFHYIPCISREASSSIYTPKDLKTSVIESLPQDKKNLCVYLCGAPDVVHNLKTYIFLQGVASDSIYIDPFLPSQS